MANFSSSVQDWNRAAIKIPATKPVSKIDVTTVFRGNYTGTVWFDGIRLMKGSILTKNTYDPDQNYVTETEDELGYLTKSTYGLYGNATSETDAKGEQKTYQYDLANQLEKLLLANGTSLNYQYDKNGNMPSKKITAADGQSQDFTYLYDENGDLTDTIGPLNDKTTNGYDDNGNLLNSKLPSGTTRSNVYDGVDRLKETSYNGVQQYVYDYDLNGNETSVQYPQENRTKNRTFDSSNRVIKQEDRGSIQEWKYASTSD